MTTLHAIIDWTIHWANTPHGAWALFGISFAESSFFPVPPDLLQIALSVATPAKSFLFATICLVGSILGAVLGYCLGLWGGRPLMHKFFSQTKVELVESYFHKYDIWAIGIAGFTPIPYKIFAVSGGAFKINFKKFILVSILSRGARFYLVASLLYFFGESIRGALLHNLNLFGIGFAGLLIGGFLIMGLLSKKQKKT